ncbi:MAG TPA: segregation protein B [Salmonella bongori]|nr:segregation protein B [Salmonella bongori]
MEGAVRHYCSDGATGAGGLLLAVTPDAEDEVKATAAEFGIDLTAIGELVEAHSGRPMVEIR